MKKITILLLALIFQISLLVSVSATTFDYKDTLKNFQQGVEDTSKDISNGDGIITLPTFESQQGQEGALTIVNAVNRFMDFFKLLIAPIAVLTMVINGIRLMTAGRESEEAATKAKNFIRYSAEGLIVVFIAGQVVNVIFGPSGEIFRQGQSGAAEFGRQTATFFEGLYSLIQVIIGSVAVLMLISAGMRYVAGSASDDQITKAKSQITWSLVGLFIIGISEFVAKDILFPQKGEVIGFEQAKQLMAQVTNFAAGTIGTLSFVFMIYAGYLYVTAMGNEDQASKAKKIITGAIIGIILAASAFAITSTIVTLDATR